MSSIWDNNSTGIFDISYSPLSCKIRYGSVVCFTYVGSHSLDDWYRFIYHTLSGPEIPNSFSVVLDLRDAEEPKKEGSMLAEHAHFWLGLKPKLQRIASMVNQPLAWGLLIHSDVSTAAKSGKSKPISEDHFKTLSVFSDYDEALEWARTGK